MKYIILCTIIITSIYAKSTDFSVDKPFNQSLLSITQNYDRTISAVGFSHNYKPESSNCCISSDAYSYLESVSNSNGIHANIIKINNSANIINLKSLNLYKFSKAISIIKTPQNGYFIGGNNLDGSLLLMKLSSDENTIFIKTFGTKNHNTLYNLIPLMDGGVLAIGSSFTSKNQHDPLFETGLGKKDIFITRFTNNGTLLWNKKYGTQDDDIGVDAVEAKDGSIVVVSQTLSYNTKTVVLMRINENGDKLWLRKIGINNKTTPKKIIALKDNNFLLVLSKIDTMQKKEIHLIKFNLYDNNILNKTIHTNYSSVINDIQELSNGNFIAVGYVHDTYNTDGLVMLIDNKLNILKQEHYGDKNYDTFNALKILNNSQIAVAGFSTKENSQESNMWIMKLNPDLSISKK